MNNKNMNNKTPFKMMFPLISLLLGFWGLIIIVFPGYLGRNVDYLGIVISITGFLAFIINFVFLQLERTIRSSFEQKINLRQNGISSFEFFDTRDFAKLLNQKILMRDCKMIIDSNSEFIISTLLNEVQNAENEFSSLKLIVNMVNANETSNNSNDYNISNCKRIHELITKKWSKNSSVRFHKPEKLLNYSNNSNIKLFIMDEHEATYFISIKFDEFEDSNKDSILKPSLIKIVCPRNFNSYYQLANYFDSTWSQSENSTSKKYNL